MYQYTVYLDYMYLKTHHVMPESECVKVGYFDYLRDVCSMSHNLTLNLATAAAPFPSVSRIP